MQVTQESILKMTVSDIKYHNKGYFFNRDTMRFFGDKMTSFGVRTFEGKRVLYRKPSATVNVFGTWKRVNKEFFNCWTVDYVSPSEIELNTTSEDFKNRFFNQLN